MSGAGLGQGEHGHSEGLNKKVALLIRFEAEDAGREPGDESLPSRRLGPRSGAGVLIC
jgi:hypothetical protein